MFRQGIASFVLTAMLVVVLACPSQARVRTYYIAANEVVWNYCPGGKDEIFNKPLPPLLPKQLGWIYHKAIYQGYTDATFRHIIARPASHAYLGILGPVIRAEVGDTILVYFKNNTTLPMSIHAHGVFYAKSSEGAPYQDGIPEADKPGDSVAPGKIFKYTWEVPPSAGPGPGDGSSIVWMYHSHVDEVNDVNSGPVGPIVVTARGMARPDGSPKDVDQEVFAMFAEFDESSSRYLPVNIADPRTNPNHRKPVGPALPDDEMWTINGLSFGNMPMPVMHVGEHVRWYLMATMSDFDFHSPHWHGNPVTVNGMHTDSVTLNPMSMIVADMTPDNPGVWLVHCHVNIHLTGGMVARYQVLP